MFLLYVFFVSGHFFKFVKSNKLLIVLFIVLDSFSEGLRFFV